MFWLRRKIANIVMLQTENTLLEQTKKEFNHAKLVQIGIVTNVLTKNIVRAAWKDLNWKHLEEMVNLLNVMLKQ